MNTVAFVVGLISLGLVAADVSHLRQNQGQQTYHANNGQAVQQSFNSRGQATYSSSSYNAGSPREVNNFFGQQAQQSSSCADSNSACVAQKSCNNGFIDQSAENKAVRSSSGRCYAPEVCCRFAQRRSAAYNLDNDVAAAGSTSEVLTAEGYVVKKPTNQYLPSYDPAPSNNQNNFIQPSPRPTPRPTPPRTQPPRTQPPRTQPPVIYTNPPQPRPTPPAPRPQIPYQPQPSNNRPVIQYDPAPVIVPVGCSAAMVCTNIQYCSASGVISKSPVSLSPEQELFRVPLTDCRKPDTKEVGKCCRDPDYTDPWPVGRTGQYVPEELNAVFDNGAYKQEPSAINPVRVKVEQEGYVVPQPSNNQARLYLPPKSNRI